MALPPFSQVIKSRDVEDPVNIWMHRPLAYGFVAVVQHTPLTPNQITLLAMLVGISAAVCWALGTPALMIVGGALLWSSAILDGADGILARAKQMSSELGRAFDGIADQIVATTTVLAAFWHIWEKHHDILHVPLMPVALITAMIQVYMYDFYKEAYMASVNPEWDGESQTLANTRSKLDEANARGAPWIVRVSWSTYVTLLTNQIQIVGLTNPRGLRHDKRFPVVNEQTTAIYKRHNYWPLQIWTFVSLCPHTYLMAIFGMLDRLDLYLWFRIVPGNVLFLIALVWQRIATTRTLRDYEEIGASPVEVE